MRRLLATFARGKRSAALLLIAVILASASVTPASASTTAWVDKPFTTGDILTLLSGGTGTPFGQSYARFARIKPYVQVIIHLQGVQPNHTYCFVIFVQSASAIKHASTGACGDSPVPGVTTNSQGNGFAQFHLYFPGSGGFYLLVDGPANPNAVTGVTLYSW